jgi:hypothetical protein
MQEGPGRFYMPNSLGVRTAAFVVHHNSIVIAGNIEEIYA